MRGRAVKPAMVPLLALTLALAGEAAFAGPLADRFLERRAARASAADPPADAANLPADIRILRDLPYGGHPAKRFDVYAPAQAHEAPVILMVHGGAWALGDKASRSVVENKVARWVARGFVFVSVNYRLLPHTEPRQQAEDVARALAVAQKQAATWGGDGGRFILMGHSAGAHLAALLTAAPALPARLGAAPWLGTVLLDSAALDVPGLMDAAHPRLYDRAFGEDRAAWQAASPYHQLEDAGPPLLAVCSTQRTDSCAQAAHFAARAQTLARRVTLLKQDLSHRDVNHRLGEDPGYTRAVEDFLRTLDAEVARRLP